MYTSIINKLSEFKKLHVNLLVVTKQRKIDEIVALYNAGQVHFGENRVSELNEKSLLLSHLPLKWHFIGHLQSNKCSELLSVSNLYMLESLDSKHLAVKLVDVMKRINSPKLNVLVQVNTSLKPSQFGIHYDKIDEIRDLVEYIIESQMLIFKGLMTIGDGNSHCFQRLQTIKEILVKEVSYCNELEDDFTMSMGMSSDWMDAIDNGSTEIRIGTSIFN